MLRVLFVDDEINVLQAIRRCLRHMRGEWKLLFANSGKEALDILSTTMCDVIVSDMKMPQMSGEELLSIVQEQYPDVARIVLSGHCNQATAFRLVGSDHFYLAKPCPTKLLIDTIKNACFVGKKADTDDISKEELKEAVVALSKILLMRGHLDFSDIPDQIKMWLPSSTVQAFAPIVEHRSEVFSSSKFGNRSSWLDEDAGTAAPAYSWEDYFNGSQ